MKVWSIGVVSNFEQFLSFCRCDVFLRRWIKEPKWISIQEGKWANVRVRNPEGTVGKGVKIMDEDLGGREVPM